MKPPATPPFSSTARDWWWVFDPRISLRARAASIAGGCGLLFTLIFASLAAGMLQRAIEKQTGASFESLAFQMSDKLDRVIAQHQRHLRLAANLAPFRSAELPATDRRRLLENFQDEARDFAWIGFADTTGQLIATTQRIIEGASVETRPWFRSGREREYAGDFHELPELTRELAAAGDDRSGRFLDLSVPVSGSDGRLLGVLGAHLHWAWAREVQQSVVPEAARRERIGVTVYSASGDVLLDSGGSGWSRPPESPTLPNARTFRGSLLENTRGGTTYLTGYARSRGFREFRGLGWIIALRQPAELVLVPARELQRHIIGWGLALTFLISIGSWISAHHLAQRLRSIGRSADRIRSGDILTVMPLPRGEGEIAVLCDALGRMVVDLRAQSNHAAAEKKIPASPDPTASPPA